MAMIRRYQARGGGRNFLVVCNFNPSCSEYALQALKKYGFLRGSFLAGKRVLRCQDRQRIVPVDDFLP